jgi:Skp family chaperone for outer membrane proteins
VRKILSSVACATALAVWAGIASPTLGQVPAGGQFAPQAGPGAGGFQTQPAGGGASPQFNPGANPAAAPSGMAGAATGMAGAPAAGAVRGPTTGGTGVNGIAVIDIAYIFKHYDRFKQQMDMMKTKVDNAEQEVKNTQEGMKKAAESMKQYRTDSPEYKRIEGDLLKQNADLQLKVNLQKKDFMEQEGKIYFTVSKEIEDAVNRFAARNNINLVLRFNGETVDPANRDDILRNINKPIVYYNSQMDITPYILQDLNRGGGGVPSANRSMAPVPQR